MRRLLVAAGAAACLALSAGAASAGVYADEMSKCLVSSATPADQTVLVQWMFSAVSANPAFKTMTNLTEAQRQGYNKAAAELFQRLLFQTCRKQAVAALKYEGPQAMVSGFELLGQVAARGMLANPSAAAELQKLNAYVDPSQMKSLAAEAGVSALEAPTKK